MRINFKSGSVHAAVWLHHMIIRPEQKLLLLAFRTTRCRRTTLSRVSSRNFVRNSSIDIDIICWCDFEVRENCIVYCIERRNWENLVKISLIMDESKSNMSPYNDLTDREWTREYHGLVSRFSDYLLSLLPIDTKLIKIPSYYYCLLLSRILESCCYMSLVLLIKLICQWHHLVKG